MGYTEKLISSALSLVLLGCGGGSGDDQTIQSPLKIELNATVIDGYLKGAKVWLDINKNFEFDENEPFAVSGEQGKVVLDVTGINNPNYYPIVAQAEKNQTIDESTGNFVTHNFVMSAPQGEVSITPLSTLVHLHLEQNTDGAETSEEFSSKLSEATYAVASSLGLNKDDVLGDYIEGSKGSVLYAAENIVASGVLPDQPSELKNISNESTGNSQFYDDVNAVNESIKHSIDYVNAHGNMSFEEQPPVYNSVKQDKECGTGFVQDSVICVVDSDNDTIDNNADADADADADTDTGGDSVADSEDTFPLNGGDIDDTDVIIPSITLTIVSPSNNKLTGDNLAIAVNIQSEFDISTVNAVVDDISTPLTYSSDAINNRWGNTPGFSGQLSLSSLTPGSYILTVTAENMLGSTVSEQRTFVLDNKPVITITEPLPLSLAKAELPLDVSCSDDVSDCEISVTVNGTELGSAINELSATLDLISYDGQLITLKFQGKDSSNQVSTETRAIYVEASANLATVKDLLGRILDFDGQRVLILISGDHGDSLSIHDITSDIATNVEVPLGLSVSSAYSFLTPTGVIYTAKPTGGSVLTQSIYDWNNSLLHDLGHPNSASSLTVAGDNAIWSVGSALWLRSFSLKTNTKVSTSAGNWNNSVGSNGVVAYWSSYEINRYDTGVNTVLTADSEYWNTYVISDGYRFVYRKHDPCCKKQQYAITYHDGITETVLTNFREREPSPGRDYRINNGWIAFTELGGLGQTHVWTRSPSGILLQRTFFGSDSYIDGLSDKGEVMLINSGRRYLSDTTAQLTNVSSALGSSTNINGTWYITIGRSLLEVR